MFRFPHLTKTNAARALAALALPLIAGCSSYYQETVVPVQDAHLNVSMNLANVGALAKTSTVSLSKLIISLTSSENDRILDTLTPTTTPALNPIATQSQTFRMSFTIKPLVAWKAVVWTLDSRDSIIHMDSLTVPPIESGHTESISWNLSPKFTAYNAQFQIPDSISFFAEGTPKEALNIDRLVLKVDGFTVADSTANPGPYFAPNATAILPFDYLTNGQHSIQLLAYGPLGSWNQAQPLFSGSTIVNVNPGQDSSLSIQLKWVGPTPVTTTIGVAIMANAGVGIGKVGTVTTNASLGSDIQ